MIIIKITIMTIMPGKFYLRNSVLFKEDGDHAGH